MLHGSVDQWLAGFVLDEEKMARKLILTKIMSARDTPMGVLHRGLAFNICMKSERLANVQCLIPLGARTLIMKYDEWGSQI